MMPKLFSPSSKPILACSSFRATSSMNGKLFLDTDIVAYSLTNDPRKKAIADDLLVDHPYISIQVVNELVNVYVRKLGYSRIENPFLR